MYRVRVVQRNGRIVTGGFLTKSSASDRFFELKAKKDLFSLSMVICLEELVNTESQEYQVHKIG